MLLERYYAGPVPYTNPDWNYLKEIWTDVQNKIFATLLAELMPTCYPDTLPCPSPVVRKHIMSIQSACMRWCTAKTSFSAPPHYISILGGSLATVQQISSCDEVCCVQEIYYIKDENCNHVEVNRTYKLKNQNGQILGNGSEFVCPFSNPKPCFWDNNSWYIQGTNSDCLTNCNNN